MSRPMLYGGGSFDDSRGKSTFLRTVYLHRASGCHWIFIRVSSSSRERLRVYDLFSAPARRLDSFRSSDSACKLLLPPPPPPPGLSLIPGRFIAATLSSRINPARACLCPSIRASSFSPPRRRRFEDFWKMVYLLLLSDEDILSLSLPPSLPCLSRNTRLS